MNDGLKQRLIGAVVLLALAMIFIPVFFDRENIEPVDRKTQIPVAPVIEKNPVPKFEQPKMETPIREMVKAPEDIFVPDETQPESLTPEKPGLDEKGVPKSWILQVASYGTEKRAITLRGELIDLGYESYTRSVKTDAGKMTRVYVGPNFNKGRILDAKKKIDKKYDISTIVLKYKP